MAFDKGIVTIEEIELDDGIWEVEGRDDSGHKIKMEVEARSGEIVKMKRRTDGDRQARAGSLSPRCYGSDINLFFAAKAAYIEVPAQVGYGDKRPS